jgi:antirestriction protein ArdC
MSNTTPSRTDVYARVTDRILADLETGVRPWLKPWESGNAQERIAIPRRHNGTPYRGINILLLWGAAMANGCCSPLWMTYRQAGELEGHVRKGEQGSLVVFADRFAKSETNDQGEEVEREIAFMRGYTVFNVEQIEGLPAQYHAKAEPLGEPPKTIESADRFFAATGATFRHGGDSAYYAPGPDYIQLPPPAAFKDAEAYAAVKAHETVHWSGHPSRLARVLGKRFGDHAYAAEELIAELGAAFLCADLGVTPEPRSDHASYLSHWIQVLKADKRVIFTAAAQAQRAVDFLHSLQPKADATQEAGELAA